jgi:hypothetical protein
MTDGGESDALIGGAHLDKKSPHPVCRRLHSRGQERLRHNGSFLGGGMDQDEKHELMSELAKAVGDAMALLMAALARQIDPLQLKRDLDALLAAAHESGHSLLAVQMAALASAGVEAEIRLRQLQESTKR